MTVAPNNSRLAYRLTEAVRLIGISRSQGYKLMESGALRTFKSGKARLVTHKALQEYLDTAEERPPKRNKRAAAKK